MKKLTNAQKKQLLQDATDFIHGWYDEIAPTPAKPFLLLLASKPGFLASNTIEDENDMFFPWKGFIEKLLKSEQEVIIKYLPRFKALVRAMERRIK